MADEPSTRVEEPIKLELTWFEQGLSDAADYWRGQARFWRRLWWATMAVAGVFAGLWLAAVLRG